MEIEQLQLKIIKCQLTIAVLLCCRKQDCSSLFKTVWKCFKLFECLCTWIFSSVYLVWIQKLPECWTSTSWYLSGKDKTEKKLIGFSFIKLAGKDSTTLCDGIHELFLYKVLRIVSQLYWAMLHLICYLLCT